MAFVVENIRLRELAIIAEQNRAFFDHFLIFLDNEGYGSLHLFVTEKDEAKGRTVLLRYFNRALPPGVHLFDGVARQYKPDRAKWLFLGWIFRDAPSQRLGPMVTSMEGRDYNRTPSDDLKYSPYARSEGISTARAVGLECNLRGLH